MRALSAQGQLRHVPQLRQPSKRQTNLHSSQMRRAQEKGKSSINFPSKIAYSLKISASGGAVPRRRDFFLIQKSARMLLQLDTPGARL